MALADTELGPARLVWGAPADAIGVATVLGTDLGYTLGGVTIMLKTSSAEKKVDQLGTTISDRVMTGLPTATVETAFAEITPTQIARMFFGTLSPSMTAGAFKAGLASFLGRSMYANAQRLIVKPIIDGVVTTNEDEWISMPKAYPEIDLSLVYNPETQRSFKCTFHCFADESDSFTVVQFGRTVA